MNSKRVLIAVTGLTPQIVTETVFALARQEPTWVPDEIRLITTRTGAENARLNLLTPETGWFHRFCKDYGLAGVRFDASTIRILKGRDGTELDDIRSPEENIAAADFITEEVRAVTQDSDSELHVSMAGGRKTMGYYAGYALSLYGRPVDRLSHVLASPPFENNRDFFYPTPYDHAIRVNQSGREITYNARNATVELADIPFVSLRHGLPAALLSGASSFRATVEAAQASLGPTSLALDPASRRIRAGTRVLSLAPAQFAVIAVLAYRMVRGMPALVAPLRDAPDPEWSQSFLRDLRDCCGAMHLSGSIEDTLTRGVDGNWFSPHLSRLQNTLRTALGPAALPYLVDQGSRPRRGYRLRLDPREISFEPINE